MCHLASANAMEGIMRTGRTILISAIVAFGAAGSILASTPIASASTHQGPMITKHTTKTIVVPFVYLQT